MWHRQHYTVKDSLRTLQTSWFCIQRINHVSLHWHSVMAYNHTIHWKTASIHTSRGKKIAQYLMRSLEIELYLRRTRSRRESTSPRWLESDCDINKSHYLTRTSVGSNTWQALISSVPNFKNIWGSGLQGSRWHESLQLSNMCAQW